MTEETWLANLPPHWTTVPFGSVFTQRKEKNANLNRDFVLSVIKDRGVVPYTDKGNIGNKVSEDLSGYKLVDPGDFVLNSMNLFMGSVGVSAYRGITSTAYIVCRPASHANAGFLNYVIRCRGFQEYVGLLGKGIMEIREAVRWTALKSTRIPLPPSDEQRRIAEFLDRETNRIDRLIESKKRLLGLLSERKEALLTEATTRSLRDATVASAGSAFFDGMPAAWQCERLRFSLESIAQGWSPQAENRACSGEEWGVLKVGCVNYGRFTPAEHKALPSNTSPRTDLEVKPGDLLMSRGNSLELVGSAAVVVDWAPRLMLSDLLYRLLVRADRARPRYLSYVLNSRPLRRQIELCASGASDTMPKISQEKIKNLVWLRPPIPEQDEIVSRLDAQLAIIDRTITATSRSLNALLESRFSLIANVVTGRVVPHRERCQERLSS